MKKIFHFLFLLLACGFVQAQNVGIGTEEPHSSAKLEISSTNSGLLIPRMTSAQRKAIADCTEGLMVYDSDKKAFMYWDGSRWQMMVPGNSSLGVPEEVTAPPTENTLRFGHKLALSGNYAAISSLKQNDGNGNRVFIYEKDSSGHWVQKQKLTTPDALPTGSFGFSLDMDSNYLVVGEPYKTVKGQSAGAVYIYKRVNGVWTFEAQLQRTNAPAEEAFGFDVSISTNTPQGIAVAVGAPEAKGLGGTQFQAGKVVLYRRTAASWLPVQTIATADFKQYDHTGYSVDIEGDLLVFGAPFHNNGNGKLYLYRYSLIANLWQKVGVDLSGATGAALGYSVSISKGVVAAGAPQLTNVPRSDEKAFVALVYQSGNQWNTHTIQAPTVFYETGMPRFGADVQLDSLNLIVGAPALMYTVSGNLSYGQQPGKATLYKLSFVNNKTTLLSSFRQEVKLDYGYTNDLFAKAVGLSGSSFVVANEQGNTAAGAFAGSVLFGTLD